MANRLYYGDNLDVLRKHIADDSVDLIYLDPPFNSKVDYNQQFKTTKGQKSPAQIQAFTDTWQWDDAISGQAVKDVKVSSYQDAAKMLDAMVGFLGKNALTAYLAMMAVRLVQLHRVLKPMGSLYLHCDPTASHYLKILLDAVFGARNFRSEIVWRRSGSHNKISRQYGPIHDVLLFYGKSALAFFQPRNTPHNLAYIDGEFRFSDSRGRYRLNEIMGSGSRTGDSGLPWNGYDPTPRGRHWAIPEAIKQFLTAKELSSGTQGQLDALLSKDLIVLSKSGRPKYKQYPTDGVPYQDIWAFQPGTHKALYQSTAAIDEDVKWLSNEEEKLGYPTQKPVGLLERILNSSSNPGDTVLDPFCGCGTTVHAAEKLGRKWIGIDITHLAIGLIEGRLRNAFPGVEFDVFGTPMDADAARDFFARNDPTKKEFEIWAAGRLGFIPQSKKGADGGVDGVRWFGVNEEYRAVVSVKGGANLGVGMVRDLDAVVTRQGAQIGVLLTLEKPTKPMLDWAAQAGLCEVPGFAAVNRLQIVSIEQALALRERAVEMPARRDDTFRKAPVEVDLRAQGKLDL
ncbi:MAG: DNA methyltransferase [Gemmobacter sp.]